MKSVTEADIKINCFPFSEGCASAQKKAKKKNPFTFTAVTPGAAVVKLCLNERFWGYELIELAAVAGGEKASSEAKSKRRKNRIWRHF